jgi:hypothetical protein
MESKRNKETKGKDGEEEGELYKSNNSLRKSKYPPELSTSRTALAQVKFTDSVCFHGYCSNGIIS